MTNPPPDSSGFFTGLLFRLAAAALLVAAGVMFIAVAAAQTATLTFTSGSWTPEKVTLTFSAPIQATPLPNASVFAVYEYTATGVWSDAPVPIASVAVSGSTVTLTLQTSLPAGSRARVFPCNDVGTCNGNALMSTNGATWSATGELTLTPPTAAFSHANVNGYIAEIYFDRDITTTQLPAASAFTISGHAAQVFDVYWSSDHVGLRIAPPVPNGVQPDITYAKPATNPLTSPGGDIAAFNIKSSSGNAFSDPGPVVTNIARNGNALVLTADAALAAPASAAASHFKACTSWSATAGQASGCTDATSYAIASRNVTLSFPAGTIQDGVKLWLLYQAVPNASASLHDASDSDRKLGLIDPHPFTISSALPTLSTASVDGATVTLTFSGNLKAASALATAAFAFTPSQVVSSAVASGKTVTITLGTAIAEGAALSVSYSQPAATATALEAADGRKLANFTSTVTNNTDTAPAVSGISVNGTTLVITFDQNLKAASTPAASAFSVSVNGSARTVSMVAIAAQAVTLTLASPVIHSDVVTVAYTVPASNPLADGTGNNAAAFAARSAANNTPVPIPAPSSASVNRTALAITFSGSLKANASLAASAFSFTPANSASAASTSGSTVNVTLGTAVADGASLSVSYTPPSMAAAAIQSADGSAIAAFNSSVSNLTDDAPALASAQSNVAGTSIILTYNEALSTAAADIPDKSAFTVSGAPAATAVAVSGSAVALTVSPALAEGAAVTVKYTRPAATEARLKDADQGNLPVATGTYTVTNRTDTAPVVSSAVVNGAALAITFDQALDTTSIPAASAFTVSVGGSARTVSSVALSGKVAMLTLATAVIHSDAVTVQYAPPSANALRDTTNNQVAAFGPIAAANQTPRPLPVVSSVSGAGSSVTIAFSDTLTANSALPKTAFTFTPAKTVSSASASGNAVSISLASALADGEAIRVAYAVPTTAADRIKAADGRDLAAFDLAVTNNTDTAPTLSSAISNTAGTALTLTFSEALLETANGKPAVSTFTITGAPAVTAVSVSGATATLSLSPALAEGATASVDYSAPAAGQARFADADQGGLPVASFNMSIDNRTDTAPVVSSAVISGTTLTLTFDQALDGNSVPASSAFSVSLDGTAAAVSAVAVSASTVTLTISSNAAPTAAVKVSYAKPAMNPLRDSSQLNVASFSNLAAANRTIPSATAAVADGSAITISFNGNLTADSTLDAGAFVLTPRYAVASAKATGKKVVLALSEAVVEDTTVSLEYDTAEASDHPLKSSAGAVPSFSITVDNQTDTTPAVIERTANGATLTIGFDQALDPNRVPAAAQFTLAGSSAQVQSASINHSGLIAPGSVVLTLNPAIHETDSVTVKYSTSQTATKNLRDPEGNDVPSFGPLSVENETDTAPAISSAAVNGDRVVVGFDQDLEVVSTVIIAHFILNGTTAAVSSGSVSNVNGKGRLALVLNQAVHEIDSVKLSYTRPLADRNANDLRDPERNRAAFTNYALDNQTDTTPVLASASADGTTVTLQFDQPLATTATPASSFALSGTSAAVASLAISGNTVTLTVSPAVHELDASVMVSYTAPSANGLRDGTGNAVANFSSTVANATDTAPVLVSVIGNQATITLRFDQPLHTAKRPQVAQFTLRGLRSSTDGSPLSSAALSTENNREVLLTLKNDLREGNRNVTVNYAKPASNGMADSTGNEVASFTATITNQTDAGPIFEYGYATNDRITLVFDQALTIPNMLPLQEESDQPATGCRGLAIFAHAPGAAPVPSDLIALMASNIKADADDRSRLQIKRPQTATTEWIASSEEVKFCYQSTVGGLADRSTPPNAAPSTDPAFQPLLNLSASATVDGTSMTLTFGETLSGAVRTADFSVSSDGRSHAVTGASMSGKAVHLTLGAAVREGEEIDVQVTYTARAGGLGATAATGAAVSVPSFIVKASNDTDTVPAVIAASAAERKVSVTFDQPVRIDGSASDLQPTFSISVNGSLRPIERIEQSEDRIVLDLVISDPIWEGDRITVAYSGQGTARIKDDDNNPAASFRRSAANLVDSPPRVVSARVRGRIATIIFDQALDEGSAPQTSEFSITGGTSVLRVIGVRGKVLTLELARAPQWDRSVRLSFTPLGGGLREPSGLAVDAFRRLQLVNATEGPQPIAVLGVERTILIEFDQPLDMSRKPPRTVWLISTRERIEVEQVYFAGEWMLGLDLSKPGLSDREDVFVTYVSNLPYRTKIADNDGYRTPTFTLMARNLTERPPEIIRTFARGALVRIEFNQRMRRVNDLQGFALEADGREIAVDRVRQSRDDWSLELHLAESVAAGEPVMLKYSPAGERALRDASGNPMGELALCIKNRTPFPLGAVVPQLESVAMSCDTVNAP